MTGVQTCALPISNSESTAYDETRSTEETSSLSDPYTSAKGDYSATVASSLSPEPAKVGRILRINLLHSTWVFSVPSLASYEASMPLCTPSPPSNSVPSLFVIEYMRRTTFKHELSTGPPKYGQ